ncbi:transglycosylase [Emydomyces testavorans]|uniref:Transglycosylase n=1 Tax=Emydomyces testavorans TaxID=2070801 RepID=A0AAF0DID6_9EURO|nr:transglycosylase [Emydomyces testavorans]
MFGHVEVEMKAAPGTGIVSSVVLQSDCLDEIDWEWVGGNNGQVQSNFFGKGHTETYDRAVWHPNPGNHDGFHKYAIDWTSDHIDFYVDGNKVRTVTPNDGNARGQFPQTPMYIKLGIWAGGDPSNAPGTIQWAGGKTDFAAGPYTMQVKNVVVTDYSTGKEYRYRDQSGNWQSIEAVGGSVRGSGTPGSGPQVQSSIPPAEATIDPTKGMPHTSTSTFRSPSVYPWIPPNPSTTLNTARTSITGIAGLPSGWLITDSGRPSSPSTASVTSPAISSSLPSSSGSPSSGAPNNPSTAPPSRPTGNNGSTLATSRVPPTSGGGANPSTTVAPGNAAARIASPYYGLAAICCMMGLVVLL